jgi:hypothetical protein
MPEVYMSFIIGRPLDKSLEKFMTGSQTYLTYPLVGTDLKRLKHI